MTRIGNRRRRRQQHPEVLRAIEAELATGASAGAVHEALTTKQAREPSFLPDLDIPSVRTISDIAREMTRDESGPWTLEDSTPAEAPLVLEILSAVSHRSGGRVRHLTKREAHLAAVYLAARPGVEGSQQGPWRAYVSARAYLAAVNRGDDLAREHLDLAAWAAIEEGIEYRPGMVDPMVKEDSGE